MQITPNVELFALKYHEKAVLEHADELLGPPDQEWTWTPVGDLKPEDLGIYASGGNSTVRQSAPNLWDSGEYQ